MWEAWCGRVSFSAEFLERVFYEQATGVKVCLWFFLSPSFCFCSCWGRDACCSPPGFYSHSRGACLKLGADFFPTAERSKDRDGSAEAIGAVKASPLPLNLQNSSGKAIYSRAAGGGMRATGRSGLNSILRLLREVVRVCAPVTSTRTSKAQPGPQWQQLNRSKRTSQSQKA